MDDHELTIPERHDESLAIAAQLRLASAAIDHVLNRIRASPEVGYYMGYGTQSFQQLCEAYAGIHGMGDDDVEDLFRPLKPRNPTTELNKRIEELEKRLHDGIGHSCYDDEPATYGPQDLTAEGIRQRVQELLGLYSKEPVRCVREISALYAAQDLPINLVLAKP